MKKKATHSDVGHLAKRVVREMRRLLMLTRLEVEGNDFEGDVALFGNYSHHARVNGLRASVKLECHTNEEDDFWCECTALRLTHQVRAPRCRLFITARSVSHFHIYAFSRRVQPQSRTIPASGPL